MRQQEIRRDASASLGRATGLRSKALTDGFAMLVAAVRRSYRRLAARRRAHLTVLELSRFDDLRLRDIGVDRADIPKVARDLIEQADDVGKRSKTAAPQRTTPVVAAPQLRTRRGESVACCG